MQQHIHHIHQPSSEATVRHRTHRAPAARRRGVVAVQVGAMMTVLVGFAALTIDVGAMYTAKAELQSAADAAALAAAGMLGEYAHGDPVTLATTQAVKVAAANRVFGQPLRLDPATDIQFGRANYNAETNSYTFTPTLTLPDAVRVVARRTSKSLNGPLPLFFAGIFGQHHSDIEAEAIAVMVPRDIAIVADLSGSMNDDSELQHVHDTQINLFDVWAGLPIDSGRAGVRNGRDPAAPARTPGKHDNQPATGPGVPGHAGGNPNSGGRALSSKDPYGPRWGWMTGWGTELIPKKYDPRRDDGLYYIPRYKTTTDPDVVQNLVEAGYSNKERQALLSSKYDSSTTCYRNRVRVLLGLAGWQSNQSGGKYAPSSGKSRKKKKNQGDNRVDTSELVQQVDYAFDGGSWNNYIDYVKGSSQMTRGDRDFRYRYGIKTYVNYLLEKQCGHRKTRELAGTPAQPVQAVKDAVHHMAGVIQALETDDRMSLEIYGQTVHHEKNLTDEYFRVTDRLDDMQASHYDGWTNMGGGMDRAIEELTESGNQRSASRKIMILLTDGMANVSEYGRCGDYNGGRRFALAQAERAARLGIRIFAVSHGFGADKKLMQQIAEIGNGEHFHAEGSIDDYSEELDDIFRTLGGKRPVELIK